MMNETKQPSVLSYAIDLPNICSLLGLLSAVLGIYFAIEGNFPLAIIGVDRGPAPVCESQKRVES